MDSFEIAAWTVVVLLVVSPAISHVPAVRRGVARLGAWLLEQLTVEPEPDPDEVELYQAIRRERLLRDLDRLRGILARDETMSAVRQIGNRMAYDRLLLDVRELPDVLVTPVRTAAARPSTSSGNVARDYHPNVEVLELGWGR